MCCRIPGEPETSCSCFCLIAPHTPVFQDVNTDGQPSHGQAWRFPILLGSVSKVLHTWMKLRGQFTQPTLLGVCGGSQPMKHAQA